MLGVLPKTGAQPKEGFLTWTLGSPGQCAIKTSGGDIILGDADERQCHRLAEQTSMLDYRVVVGPDHTANWFSQRAVELGSTFADPSPQRIHALSEKPIYPGAFYYSYKNDLANIGVVYNSVNGVKYTGYRQLSISYLADPSNPDNFISAAVARSDIQPSNGVVHVLALSLETNIGEVFTSPQANFFGFGTEFMLEVVLNK